MRRRCSARSLPASPTTQPRAGSAKGTEPRSVPARRCARKPQRVNPQTRTASARAVAGGERTYNVRHYATLGRCPERESASVEGQTGAPTRGLALPGRGGRTRPPRSMNPSPPALSAVEGQRSGGVSPPLPRSRRRPSSRASAGAVGAQAAFLSSLCDVPRRRHNEHEAPPVNTIAFRATSYRRRTAVAEPWRAGCLPQQPA
jgi:hypothetical protein